MKRQLIDVMAAVIVKDGRYLICRRPQHKRHGGLWEFPGGKVEPGESFAGAVTREMTEELRVTVSSVLDPLWQVHDPGSVFRIHFVPTEILGEPVPVEHIDIAWAYSTDLASYPLAPSDLQFAEEFLLKQGG